MEKEKINFYLVLEKRLGDYNIIDISKLDIFKPEQKMSGDISDIDFFTCEFTEQEIRESVIRSNMVREEYIDGDFRIISDAKHKHNLSIITKDVYNEIRNFQNNNEEFSQDFKNKLFGAYKKIVESCFNDPDFIHGLLERFKITLKNGTKLEMFKMIEELPYYKSRSIYINMYKELTKNNVKELQSETNNNKTIEFNSYHAKRNQEKRVLEKLNDVA